jgi:hypothetical protein
MPTKHPGEIIAQTRQPGVVLVGTSSRLLRSRRYSYYREQPGLNVHEQAAPSRVPVQLSPWPAPRPVAGNGKAEQPTQAGPTSRT